MTEHRVFVYNAAKPGESPQYVRRSFCGIDHVIGASEGEETIGEECSSCAKVRERMEAAKRQLEAAFRLATRKLMLSFVYGGAPSGRRYAVEGTTGWAKVQTVIEMGETLAPPDPRIEAYRAQMASEEAKAATDAARS